MSIVATHLVHLVQNFHFKKGVISLHLKHLHFCFRLPVNILCLNLKSRQQVWLVHCEDFLCVCYLWYFPLCFSGQELKSFNAFLKFRPTKEVQLYKSLTTIFPFFCLYRKSYWWRLNPLFVLLSLCCSSAKKDSPWKHKEGNHSQWSHIGYGLCFRRILFHITCISNCFREGQEKQLQRPLTLAVHTLACNHCFKTDFKKCKPIH